MKTSKLMFTGPKGQQMVQLATCGPNGWLITQGLARDLEVLERQQADLVARASGTDPLKGIVVQPNAKLVRKVLVGQILDDSDPMNPRTEWDNCAVISCAKSVRYAISDRDQELPDDVRSEDELREYVGEPLAALKPLYLFDHSGITISTSPFSCPWDSGQIGWVYITEAVAKKEWAPSSEYPTMEGWAEKVIDGEIKTFDFYVRGECYGYQVLEVTVEDDDQMEDIEPFLAKDVVAGSFYGADELPDWVESQSDEMDSCWGYFGLDDAQDVLKHALESFREEAASPEPATT